MGILVVQQAALQITCHSEPVLKLVWESPSSLRRCPPEDGDCHTSDIGLLYRNDREFGFAMTREVDSAL